MPSRPKLFFRPRRSREIPRGSGNKSRSTILQQLNPENEGEKVRNPSIFEIPSPFLEKDKERTLSQNPKMQPKTTKNNLIPLILGHICILNPTFGA